MGSSACQAVALMLSAAPFVLRGQEMEIPAPSNRERVPVEEPEESEVLRRQKERAERIQARRKQQSKVRGQVVVLEEDGTRYRPRSGSLRLWLITGTGPPDARMARVCSVSISRLSEV